MSEVTGIRDETANLDLEKVEQDSEMLGAMRSRSAGNQAHRASQLAAQRVEVAEAEKWPLSNLFGRAGNATAAAASKAADLISDPEATIRKYTDPIMAFVHRAINATVAVATMVADFQVKVNSTVAGLKLLQEPAVCESLPNVTLPSLLANLSTNSTDAAVAKVNATAVSSLTALCEVHQALRLKINGMLAANDKAHGLLLEGIKKLDSAQAAEEAVIEAAADRVKSFSDRIGNLSLAVPRLSR